MFRMMICHDGRCGCVLDDGMLDMFYFDGLWRWTGIVIYVTGGIIGVKTLIINGRSSLCATTSTMPHFTASILGATPHS